MATSGDIAGVSRQTVIDLGTLMDGDLTDDRKVCLIMERADVVLGQDMPLDITTDGTYGAALTPGLLRAGDAVTSVLLHADRASATGVSSLHGRVEFDDEILGVVVRKTSLDAWDGAAGLVLVSYPVATQERGLELADQQEGDGITIAGNVLLLDLNVAYPLDQLRVILPANPPGVTFSIDAQGPTWNTAPAWGPGPISAGDLLTVGDPGSPGPNRAMVSPTMAPGVMLEPADLGVLNSGVGDVIEIDALSFGRDRGRTLLFSVDEFADGDGSPVSPSVDTEGEFGNAEASADIFRYLGPARRTLPGFVAGNRQRLDGDGMIPTGRPGFGLIENNPATYCAWPDPGDNLDAVDFGTVAADLQGRIYFSLDTFYDDPHECSIPPGFATAAANGVSPADVLSAYYGLGTFRVYVSAEDLGLDPLKDDIDALIVLDDGDGEYNRADDTVLFSLRRASTSIGATCPLTGLPICEADVLAPGPAIYIPGEALSLKCRTAALGEIGDDLVAMDRVRAQGAPVGNNDQTDTNPNDVVVIPVLDNDWSLDGALDPSSVKIFAAPRLGQIEYVDPATGAIHYRARGDVSGEDTFSYVVHDDMGECSDVVEVTVSISGVAAVGRDEEPVRRTMISFAGPNPFTGETAFRLSPRVDGRATVEIYNLAGQLVRTLLDENLAAGDSRVLFWDGCDGSGRNSASGVYLVRMRTATAQQGLRVMYIR